MKSQLYVRVLAVLLCVAMLVTSMPLLALAEEVEQDTTLEQEALPGEGENTGEGELPEGIPEESPDDEEDIFAFVVDVTSVEELEEELQLQTRAIRLVEDIVLDRTLYITADTVIFTEQAHTLTRAADFAGDMFVVGEAADGTLCESAVTLTLGHPDSREKDLLTIDGNKDAMKVAVTGAVLFVVGGATVELHENVTITNHKKVGNEKTLTEAYGVSYVHRVGGAMAIVAAGAAMDIFGGSYTNNSVNDITDTSTEEGQTSTYGGAIYNFGTVNIYGGTFEGNHAARGGMLYCYRTTRIYNAQILKNTASTYGGAIYMPSSTAAFLFLGGENDYAASRIVFRENTATNNGGAIYSRNKLEAQDVQFIGNSATGGSGGAVSGGEMQLSFVNTVFEDNTAKSYGAAIYYTSENGKEDIPDLTCVDVVFRNNSVSATGGALYMNGNATAQMENAEFISNTAKNNGGAVYLNNGHIDIDGGSFINNSCSSTGGAISANNEASIRLNRITATGNSGKGGFIYCTGASAYLWDSTVQENTSTGGGGALYLDEGAFGGAYATTFHKNHAALNGGALFIYTDGYTNETKVELNSCIFTENIADDYGGAIYASQRSVIDLYNSTAKKNSAARGGFLYHTTTNTTINLASLILEGNTATDGGPIIWGNSNGAVLNLDTALYIDNDYEGDLDDAYWAAAIYNKLKVNFVVLEVPNYIGYDGSVVVPVVPRIPVDVASAAELEAALENGKDLLHITADFEIDRTFYIYRNTTIYTTEAHTLTRAADFGGDIFVVGERSAGEMCENLVTLELGAPDSTANDLLTIDGNKGNMKVPVTGSVIFVTCNHSAKLYPNLTVTNHKKVDNEKTLTGEYGVSYVGNVGGAVAIITNKASMDIYGGIYSNNETMDLVKTDTETIETSTHGGAFYNYGTLNVYGGIFEGNHASRGGVFYCYRTTNIYNAIIRNNTASTYGGAIYMPNSTAAFLYLGGKNDYADSQVIFQGNTATNNGGAIYAKNKMEARDTQFIGNSANASGGAITAGEMQLSFSNTVFEDNTAKNYGAAIYYAGENGKEDIYDLTCTELVFRNNSVSATGGALYMNGNATAQMENVEFTSNTAKNNGGAIYLNNGHVHIDGGDFTGNSAAVGGAAALTNGSDITVNGGSFTDNSSTGEGGALTLKTASSAVLNKITATQNSGGSGGFAYVNEGTLTVYRSRFEENTTTGQGGALYMHTDAAGAIYDTDFVGNTATKSTSNGGALALYTGGTEVLIHSCRFTGNNAGNFGGAAWISGKTQAKIYNITAKKNSASYGGFLYETAAGTVVTMVGVTVSGNTATTGGPIIWGNTYNAILYLDKSRFTDEDHTGALDDAYWATAIVNKLTVKDCSEEIPKWLDYNEEAYDHMADAVDVSTADQLEAAIAAGAKHIRVIADFAIDRTFYISGETTIFSTLPRTLTRAADFGGDMFVVGQNAQGTSALLLGNGAKLVLGNSLSQQNDLLTIDGNKDNMTVPVVGSALFICYSGKVDLHKNVTAQNMHKVGNERTYEEAYAVPIANRVGGTLAAVVSGTLNIYGGIYRNNLVNDEDASSEETRISSVGGLIFNNGNVHIHGGLFENNQAARGGVVYNYKILRIYGGDFIGNVATVSGGVMYAPNAAACHTYIGSSDSDASTVLFRGNTATSNGGALCSSALCSLVIYGNTVFDGNTSASSGGAISNYGQLTARDTVFSGNSAKNLGGAVYTATSNATYVTRFTRLEGNTFENNQATRGGALAVYATNSEFENGAIANVTNCTFTGNMAAAVSKSTASYGGAIFVERKSTLTVDGSAFSNNQARTEGGAVYAGGASTMTVSDTNFTENAILDNGKHGGAISLHSVTLNATAVNFTGNTAGANGGALYVSYASAHDRNSAVTLKDSTFTNNSTQSLGGAMYVTKQAVTKETRILTAGNTAFTSNSATAGGAAYFCAGVQAYMTDTDFTKNQALEGNGGAIATSGGILELDTATFTGNTTEGLGGAIHQLGQAQVILYAATAKKNASVGSGGFLYAEDGTLSVYNSLIQQNSTENNGGGMALYGGAAGNIYTTEFTQNTSAGNGAGVFLYTNLTPCVFHSCSFTGNSGAYGGAIYASGKAVASLYKTVARNNESTRGGFLYHTTTGTELTLAGTTVSGNTATKGGPIIWGNSTGAVLHLDKSQFVDEDHTGSLNDVYWSAAIYNALTVNDISVRIPACATYTSKRDDSTKPPVTKQPVPVTDVFDLAKNSSDGDINNTYKTFPRLDNSRNLMSQNVTTFENINGGTVTVDTFVYPTNGTADNTNVGLGLLVYQAMCYKQRFPEEEVYIDVSSYRFSVSAAVNINRNSRYFGYMRQLYGTANYDEYGFVRIAYLLISAAKMGIHVTAIGHIDAYPLDTNAPCLDTYFTSQFADPCDPAYVENGCIGDYFTFCQVAWSLEQKGGTDMMHTKLCAVSHYLDMNGVAHKNAVWTGSSNLDGITAKGLNANWKLQTATVITNHQEIYQASVNYLRTILRYPGQEDVYEFQDQINRLSTKQAQLILAGRESEIPADEQIIYLGSESDDVFELYFTPMGGSTLAWDEVQNPYCKYMRKLYDSEDYILFTWNAAEYSSGYIFGDQLESMLIEAFHKNRNINNRIYGRMEYFDSSAFDDLQVGVDIGYKSFNSLAFGEVHNKDLQFSYVENGQRHYVSLLNSMNFHSGSMYYQSNFALVIKETSCRESSVFFTLADLTTTGIVQHDYGEEQDYLPEDIHEDGYTYKACQQCNKREITGILHRTGEWVIDRAATATHVGIRHKACTVCGTVTDRGTFTYGASNPVDLKAPDGQTFGVDDRHIIKLSDSVMPATFEATIQLPKHHTGRGGVLISNHEKVGKTTFSWEVYTGGRIRLYFINNSQYVNQIFKTDIRSDEPRHIALSVDGTTALLYVDSELAETAQLALPLPELHRNFVVGGDYREGNAQHFKGTIYSASLFSDVRTADEIYTDRIVVPADTDNLLYTEQFYDRVETPVAYTAITAAAKTFDEDAAYPVEQPFDAGVKTIEATLQVPPSLNNAGVILGNFGTKTGGQMFLDVCDGGRLRLHYTTEDGQESSVILSEDIRSEHPIHMAVTIDGDTATTYINGALAHTAALTLPLPELTDGFVIGGDNRPGNPHYFRGKLYAVNMFSDVRTAQEIGQDMLVISGSEEGLLFSRYFVVDNQALEGSTFTSVAPYAVEKELASAPYTFEATIQVPKSMANRAGVIVGNYDGSLDAQVSLEVYYKGCVRLYYQRKGGQKMSCLFNTDIRSEDATHIAVTVSEDTATLYVNGQLAETMALTVRYPQVTTDFMIGGDRRFANEQYFKGQIYSVSLFDHVRTEDQILADMTEIAEGTEGLLLNKHFGDVSSKPVTAVSGVDGKKFSVQTAEAVGAQFAVAPKTLEAIIHVPTDLTDRGGVVVGNYNGTGQAQINLEIYYNGKARLYLNNGRAKQTVLFQTDIRSDGPVHVAVTLEDALATLYVNGAAVETAALSGPLPEATQQFLVGGDRRTGNDQYFKGTIYAVSLFDHVRTADEIKQDVVFVQPDVAGVLYTKCYTAKEADICIPDAEAGRVFTAENPDRLPDTLSAAPKTIEAVVQVPLSMQGRVGVIVGNYNNASQPQINLEVYFKGQVRLYLNNGSEKQTVLFQTDIRSDAPVYLAVTIEEEMATLYVDGKVVETTPLEVAPPEAVERFLVGGDRRMGNPQYFKGTIFAVSLFDHVRTLEQIQKDNAFVSDDTQGLLYTRQYVTETMVSGVPVTGGATFTADRVWSAPQTLSAPPQTIETTVCLPKALFTAGGTIIGNSGDDSKDAAYLTVDRYGKLTLHSRSNGLVAKCMFVTDIRSDAAIHLAVTVDNGLAKLYINGQLTEQMRLGMPALTATDHFQVGGSAANTDYFKGTIYSVYLFSYVRTPEQIRKDVLSAPVEDEGLVLAKVFDTTVCFQNATGFDHIEGEWILDRCPDENSDGLMHTVCTLCGKNLRTSQAAVDEDNAFGVDIKDFIGLSPEAPRPMLEQALSTMPKTYEFMLQIPKTMTARGGVLFGNYNGGKGNFFNLEIYYNGKPRVWYKIGSTSYTHQFSADVRSDEMTALAFTIDGLNVNLYVNGKLVETAKLTKTIPETLLNYHIGTDDRADNPQSFQGTLYAVNLFSDIRTPEELAIDAILVAPTEENLLYSQYFTDTSAQRYNLEGKTIVNFGDSVFGNYKSPVDISSMIATKTFATVHNVGFGSAQMSENSTAKYEPFGMKNLADAITTGDWTTQDAVINSGNAPTAFKRCLLTLKSIDFNTVDIITIAYGTNDFKNGKSLDDVKNAARYSIETIKNKYPHIEIVLCTPVYRYWIDDAGNFVEDSNTKEINGIKLTDYIQLYEEIGKEYGVVVIDNYSGSGITASNRADCFTGTDTTHPNETGRQMIAENMAKELYKHFG